MRKIKFIAMLFVSALGVHAGAQDLLIPALACPAIGDEYEQMISKLDAIKTAIKQDANCKNVELQVKSLQDLVTKDRETVIGIIDAANGQSLTADQSKTVRDYAENVTKKVAALNDLFTRSNYCFRGDQPQDQLTTLAGFVGEASQMISSLSGPWGTPIALAGNVIAGFMTGLDSIYKSRAGFDFQKRDQWKSYVNSLCTYYSYRDQISHLLNPQARLNQLQSLKDRLDAQITKMSTECEECRGMVNSFEAQKAMGPEGLTKFYSGAVASANSKFNKPYGTYMLQSLGLRDWVNQESVRVQREANSYWADASGRHLLFQAKEDIEQFLIAKEGPRFLNFGVQQSLGDYHDFVSFVNVEGRRLYYNLYNTDTTLVAGRASWIVSLTAPEDLFRGLALTPIEWNKLSANDPDTASLQYQWNHFRTQGIDRFRNAQATAQVVQTFCSFFQHAGFFSSDVRNSCESPAFGNLLDNEDKLAVEMRNAGVAATAPFVENQDAYMDRLDLLNKGIEQRGISR